VFNSSARRAKPLRLALAIAATLMVVVVGFLVGSRLQAKAHRASEARIELAQLQTLAATLETMPWTSDSGPGEAVATRQRMQSAHTQIVAMYDHLDGDGERADLSQARSYMEREYAVLTTARKLVTQGRRDEAEALSLNTRGLSVSENWYLELASKDFDRSKRAAVAVANVGTIVALLLAVLMTAFLFWRFTRATSFASRVSGLSDSLIASSVDGVFAFDHDLRYTVWNHASEVLTGLPRADMLGRRPDEIPIGHRQHTLDARTAALRGETVELRNESITLPERGTLTFDISYAPLRDRNGKIIGGLGHIHDVTRRKELEQQLIQSQKLEAIGQLAGGIAHDFNNLLMSIGGHASLALKRAPESDTVLRHGLREIEQVAVRGRTLTEQLLFFARRRSRRSEALDLNALVREAVELLRRLIESSVLIELDLREPAWIVGDAGQLEQVLLNLGSNAADAMPDGGVLTIRTGSADPGHVQLTIEDTGTGIPDDVKAHVFEPFFTTKGVGHGTGLGLATAYGIVTQNGGSIELDTTVGSGTTFTITLPSSTQVTAQPIPAGVPAANDATATILLVDDDSVVRGLIAAGLESEGYAVIAKPAPSDALSYVEGGGVFDFLITDVVMPGLGGGELVERIRSAVGSSFDTIYVSGYAASGITLDERSVFLQKPFELGELYAVVERVLKERSEGVLGSARGVAGVAG
jgi:PAS domain S-box-containing protein